MDGGATGVRASNTTITSRVLQVASEVIPYYGNRQGKKQERQAVSAGGPHAPKDISSYTVFKTVRCEVTDSYGILYRESKSDGREQSAGPSGLFPLLPVCRLCVPAAAFPDLETK